MHRGFFTQPSETERALFRGVHYRRVVVTKPRPITLYVLRIETRTPGLRFLVTPPDAPGAELPLRARTASAFLREHRLQAAINADFFYPWKSSNALDYYPHNGDPVTVEGDAVSNGVRYASRDHPKLVTLYISQDNRPSLNPPKNGQPWNALGAHPLLANGVSLVEGGGAREPRTAAGWTADGAILYLVCADGRQPGYSEGATLAELVSYFRSVGVRDAVNLDGGGSTALVVAGKAGSSQVLNRPIDQRIPGKERFVANHLGIYAPPLP